ncbi:MAG: F0F1 ATP synthase subunit epsilon [Gemmatimonadota bacterium]
MAATIRLEVVTPERLLVSEDVDEIIAPGHEGEFGVLPEHTQFLSILEIGILRYRRGSDVRKMAVGGGFAEVMPDRVVVMADVAEKAEEIDVERARRAHARAEELLRNLSLDDATYAKAHAALQRAIARMAAAG